MGCSPDLYANKWTYIQKNLLSYKSQVIMEQSLRTWMIPMASVPCSQMRGTPLVSTLIVMLANLPGLQSTLAVPISNAPLEVTFTTTPLLKSE